MGRCTNKFCYGKNTAMESALAATETHMLDSLDFRLRPSANYVEARQEVTFYNNGGNSFSSQGVRTLSFSLASSTGYLDPSSIVIRFKVANRSTTHALKFITPDPACVFSQVRCLVNGVEIESLGSS